MLLCVTGGRRLDCSAPVGNERNFHTTWHSSSKTSENPWQCMSHKHTHTHTLHKDNFHFSWLGGLPGLSLSLSHSFFPPISLFLFLTACLTDIPGAPVVVSVSQWRWRWGPRSTMVSLPPHTHPAARSGGLR